MDFQKLAEQYKSELFNNILPFWLEKSQDAEFGGYLTCLDKEGNVYDTDKFVWLQGREVWMFAMLYNKVEKRSEWLECAIQGAEFLKNHGHDGDFNWYFSLTREGKPLVDPYNIFSYTFATMAFGQLALATGNKEYEQIAKITFEKVLSKVENPKGKWNKAHAGTRELKNFALPMILCNLALEIEHLLDEDFLLETMETCIHEVMEVFYRPELGIIVENVTLEGELSDTFEGRLVNPGHAIEAMWFIMDLGERLQRPELIQKATDIALQMVKYGWDETYDGIFYFMDRKGLPQQQLEWDQKLWWVHVETLITMIKGYQLTGSTECLTWFKKTHEYTWTHFKDTEYPEWFGYLNRQGDVLLNLKGGKWKGCFHVPRGLYQCWQVLKKIQNKTNLKNTIYIMNKACNYIIISLTLFLISSCSTTQTIDVLIVGGGASGTTAGIQSARLGSKTIIIEETEWLGGMLTSAGVSAIDGNNKLPGGLWGELRDSLAARYGGLQNLETGWVSNTLFEPSVGASVLANMCKKEQNLDVWLHAKFVSAVKTKKGWNVKIRKGDSVFEINAKVLIDATELGDVAKACGVKYDIGMDSRHVSGEDIAPEFANDIVQDLTYVLILKDYGPNADKTIDKPANYNPGLYACSCMTPGCKNPKESSRVWDCPTMLTYGKLPNNKYMINWPTEGNDYYVNLIEMTEEERIEALEGAKEISLGFLYYIQKELGYKNLGIADDEFPTADKLPFIPYHRESRRIHGLVRFNINHITHPFDQEEKLYRTGIAVGDYPVDHHHTRYPNWSELPDLHFYPVPSYSLPLGTIIPKDIENLIVAEKSISVTNLVNGTTRLQPVVLQIGQVSGVLAALAVRDKMSITDIPVRTVQNAILNANGYIMPYLDLPLADKHFKALQRIGSTGILRGEGKNVGWSNETWFNTDSILKADHLKDGLYEFCGMNMQVKPEFISIGNAASILNSIADQFKLKIYSSKEFEDAWNKLGLNNYDSNRLITRKEFAVMLDFAIDPFNVKQVNIKGEFTN